MVKLLLTGLVAAGVPPVVAAQAAPAAASASAKFTLDTPVQDIVADAKGKAVLDADLPMLTSHPHYEAFKGMSLRQLQAFAPDKMTDAVLAKVATDLSAAK